MPFQVDRYKNKQYKTVKAHKKQCNGFGMALEAQKERERERKNDGNNIKMS